MLSRRSFLAYLLATGCGAEGSRVPEGFTSGPTLTTPIVYPWDSMSDVVDGWVARAKYVTLDGSSVAAWVGTKGVLQMQQMSPVAQPAWETSAFNGKSSIAGDGVASLLRCDALSAYATGADAPWSVVTSFQKISPAKHSRLFGFGNSAQPMHSLHELYLASNSQLAMLRQDDSWTVAESQTTQTLDTSRHVLSVVFSGTALSMWLDGAATSIASAAHDVGAVTLDSFALLGGVRTQELSPMAARVRAFVFANSALSTPNRQAIEAALVSEI